MKPFDAHHERRGGKRLRMGCRAKMKSHHTGETHYGECVDLSVDGLAIRSAFVPQFGEILEVTIIVPPVGEVYSKPFEAVVEVRRCNEVERGKLYEIGAKIIKR
ncbi:PilZ domain-containing protein [Vogesella sp. LYT5W]|uniref:PilZ domain-containing protein n=1 Tax=Vogesella margarita TaxID=2984199 RepID=A0ABT5IMR9_9NEIS|nr:PilZ domain-containing protein [Vogesella margarita]MDC7713861.1 PilZ domain-containing protein [Vogesella margarita]